MESESTENTTWEQEALTMAHASLESGFSLYDFHIVKGKKGVRFQVFIDKPGDEHGSPNVEECEQFSHLFQHKLESLAGVPENYTIEVSSPGAERMLKIPEDFERFRAHPMKVQYEADGKVLHKILEYLSHNESRTHWKTADVKINRQQGLIGKKREAEEIAIDLDHIQKVNLHLDF